MFCPTGREFGNASLENSLPKPGKYFNDVQPLETDALTGLMADDTPDRIRSTALEYEEDEEEEEEEEKEE